VRAGVEPEPDPFAITSPLPPISPDPPRSSDGTRARDADDGFTTATVAGGGGAGGRPESVERTIGGLRPTLSNAGGGGVARRHQIPGLRRTPYLKILIVRCDDNETYKAQTRAEIREWIKEHATPTAPSKKSAAGSSDNHDAFEWMILHVVLPNTAAAGQPRTSKSTDGGDGASGSAMGAAGGSGTDLTTKGSVKGSRWRGSSSTLLEKLRSDFNSSGKGALDRVAQIRIGINDVPYDALPRVVPAVPSGYVESPAEAEVAWADLVAKLKGLILASFDSRVSQYEEDIREKDAQRSLPGWNFCTFFILKEGLARGFESVGLVEDALVGYDELGVGLDMIVQELAEGRKTTASSLLEHTAELAEAAARAVDVINSGSMDFGGERVEDLQQSDVSKRSSGLDDEIPISANKKSYRDMILANDVSLFDFRCYIFARQIALLLRLGNAWSTREELLAKLREQQETVLHGVAGRQTPAPFHRSGEETENLAMLAEICRRTLEFVPAVSQVMRADIISSLTKGKSDELDAAMSEAVDNLVSSFAFSVAQQILAQTSSKALPVPSAAFGADTEQKSSIPEPKTMMHPARSTSLHVRASQPQPPSPGVFPGPGNRQSLPAGDGASNQLLKAGLEELAGRRAELYAMSRNILEEGGKKRDWSDGWDGAPLLQDVESSEMVDVNLDEDTWTDKTKLKTQIAKGNRLVSTAGITNRVLRTALDNKDDFYRLYETLTDKALRHYSVADHAHAVHATLADLAVLKYHLEEYDEAAAYFHRTTPFFGESGWSLLELSMLVMYARCLRELQRQETYVQVLIKLLGKAAGAERERVQRRAAFGTRSAQTERVPDMEELGGFFDDLLTVTEGLPNEVRIPAATFLHELEIEGGPMYGEEQDSFALQCRIYSLLADAVELKGVKARLVAAASSAAGTTREIWLENTGAVQLRPGRNTIKLGSNTVLPGTWEMDTVKLTAGNISLFHERKPFQAASQQDSSALLRKPTIHLFHRANSLDVVLSAGRHTQLDKNNTLDLELSTGWNDVTHAEVRIKSATGGLRLLMAEAETVASPHGADVSHPEGGMFVLRKLGSEVKVIVRFPFSTETEIPSVAVKVEVVYDTPRGRFTFAKTPTVAVGLALGVNVQDVFMHGALFSRFTVSTAAGGPLRLHGSELIESDLFSSDEGYGLEHVEDGEGVMVFAKQPATLLYRIARKPAPRQASGNMQKTMYLKLFYSVLQDEVEALLIEEVTTALRETKLVDYAAVIADCLRDELRQSSTPTELERTALLSEVSTSFVEEVQWERHLAGLGKDVSAAAGAFLKAWQHDHPMLRLLSGQKSVASLQRSILIPVDIPSIAVLHTADIRLDTPSTSTTADSKEQPFERSFDADGLPLFFVNQLVPAVLHLKWTRIWDTADIGSVTISDGGKSVERDLEFSYEVSAPGDSWLLGGRRKGHFVIPGVDSGSGQLQALSSTPDTEADIPLLLVPLREGWLPYPSVEIREVRYSSSSSNSGAGMSSSDGMGDGVGLGLSNVAGVSGGIAGGCETDWKNLGETVRVVADRGRVTVSLDASGSGGGPLVLESESLVGSAQIGRIAV
jgi:trafficking protein particle complex subunit 10